MRGRAHAASHPGAREGREPGGSNTASVVAPKTRERSRTKRAVMRLCGDGAHGTRRASRRRRRSQVMSTKSMNKLRKWIQVLELFVSVSAVIGGALLVARPDGSL